jgi:hypothetical protein
MRGRMAGAFASDELLDQWDADGARVLGPDQAFQRTQHRAEQRCVQPRGSAHDGPSDVDLEVRPKPAAFRKCPGLG